MLKKYIEGSNVSLLNTMYLYPKRQENGKYDHGSMTLVYKDLNTNEKHVECIDDPEIEYYVLNEGERVPPKALFVEKDKVTMKTSKFRNLERDLAKLTGKEEFYKDNIYNGNRYMNRHIHSDSINIFNSDMNINDFYRYKFDRMYKNKPFKATKSYFDIEVDGLHQMGDFPEPGECPINAITYIDSEHMCVLTLLLRNGAEPNPLIEEFENSVNDELYTKLKSFIRERVGGEKNERKFGLDKMQYKILFYGKEIQLIYDFFNIVNKFKPDFLLAWNMRFDVPYIIQRIMNLGYDPAIIASHPDFEHKYFSYYIDNRAEEVPERCDACKISSYSVYIDQMIQFASRRKAKKGAFASWKLDYIGDVTTGIRKLDYSHITTDIAKLPYLNYEVFVFYNIMDTIVQYCIEHKVNDIDFLINKAMVNNTRYEKVHRQTVYLANRATKFFNNMDLVISNNKNVFNPKPTEKFPGAHVADPKRLNDYSKMKLNGVPIMIFQNLDDFDYKSMYPSDISEFNIASNTQIGRIFIKDKIYENENPYKSEYYCREGAFIEDFHSHNYIEFCHRWFNLAGYKDLCKDIEYYFNFIRRPQVLPSMTYDGQKVVINYLGRKDDNLKDVITFHKTKEVIHSNEVQPDMTDIVNNINVNQIVYKEN